MCVCSWYNNTLNLRCLLIENQFIIFKTDKNKEELNVLLIFFYELYHWRTKEMWGSSPYKDSNYYVSINDRNGISPFCNH